MTAREFRGLKAMCGGNVEKDKSPQKPVASELPEKEPSSTFLTPSFPGQPPLLPGKGPHTTYRPVATCGAVSFT